MATDHASATRTRGDIFPPSRQRPALLALADRLDSRASALRRDECGDWRIAGQRGHIYADGPESFVVVVSTPATRSWNVAKATLAPFATLTQDGDDEGAFTVDRLPAPDEGTTLRRALLIPKRRHLSDEERERHGARLRAMALSRA